MKFILVILFLVNTAFAAPIKVTGMDKYSVDEKGKGPESFGTHTLNDNPIFGFLFIDRLEEKLKGDDDTLLWDLTGRFGNQFHRLYLESEGDYNTSTGEIKDSRNELLYG